MLRNKNIWQIGSLKNLFYLNNPLYINKYVCLNEIKNKYYSVMSKMNSANKSNQRDIICQMKNVSVSIPGGREIFKDVNLTFLNGSKIGMIGSNGSGKSTLMRTMIGLEKEYDGEIWRKPDLKIGYLAQEPELDIHKNVYENILDGLKESFDLLEQYNKISNDMCELNANINDLLIKQGELQEKIDYLDCWDSSYKIDIAMKALNVPNKDKNVIHLSGGEKRRVALCRLLLENNDILLLDEPTNHLDAESVAWLESFLRNYKGAVLSITHDRYFLDSVANWILEIDNGKCYPFLGNYSKWMIHKQERLNLESKKEKYIAKQMKNEMEWIQNRQKNKNGLSKAREKRLENQIENKLQNNVKKIENGQIVIPSGPHLGNRVLKVKNISKKLNDGRILFSNLSFEIEKNSIIGVIGANGTGKSSLFDILAGIKKPDTGHIEYGETVKLGFVSQSRDSMNPKNNIFEEITGGQTYIDMNGQRINARAYIATFNLRGTIQEKKINMLSGGEKNRVHLAKELLKRNNVILLDEPTNDLDVNTLRSLEIALDNFNGVTMIISHDRFFLDRICTHIIAFEGNGKVEFFHGNFSQYEQKTKKQIESI